MDNNKLISIGLFWNKNINMLRLLKLQAKIESTLQKKYYLRLSSRSDLLNRYFYDKYSCEYIVGIYVIYCKNIPKDIKLNYAIIPKNIQKQDLIEIKKHLYLFQNELYGYAFY